MNTEDINKILADLEKLKYGIGTIEQNYDYIIEIIDRAIDTITILTLKNN